MYTLMNTPLSYPDLNHAAPTYVHASTALFKQLHLASDSQALATASTNQALRTDLRSKRGVPLKSRIPRKGARKLGKEGINEEI